MSDSEVNMDRGGFIESVRDFETTVVRLSVNGNTDGYVCFIIELKEQDGNDMRLWASDELDPELIAKINDNSQIVFSAERDEDGDMVMTECKVVH